MSRHLISTIARRAAFGLGGTAVAGCTAVTAYTSTDQGLGLRREIRFWGRVAPIVFDYWWHISSSSPWVNFQDRFYNNDDDSEAIDHPSDEGVEYKSEHERDVYKKLHERNAPQIYSIMLELGGLYIKLGQVLSVTALPVPTEYRTLFRTLQSSVPGHEEFESVIRPTLESAFQKPLEEIFESIEEIPCGAASIGQAHKAKLLVSNSNGSSNNNDDGEENCTTDVIIKVQYPDAKWQVPADVHCVGDFLKLCVYFKVVDESSARLSYEEFSRQFLAELDYLQETRNLQEVYESSLDPNAPYIKRGVEVPRVFPDLCTNQLITMSYIPGPKFEEEARKQLEALGIDTSRGVQSVVRDDETQRANSERAASNGILRVSKSSSLPVSGQPKNNSWLRTMAERVGSLVGVDNILYLMRLARQAFLWSTVAAVKTIQFAPSVIPVSAVWLEWAKDHESAASQAEMLDWTNDAIDALFDVHGYQIFNQGLFNADAHPGNILIIQNNDGKDTDGKRNRSSERPKLGLIDYGQCKRLNPEERQKVARLVLSVANDESDEEIASLCRALGFVTKNNSTPFLSSFARLMFGKFRSEHLDRSWHKSLHDQDQILYFPTELSMVYRASVLLRGLAMSFQLNVSVGEKWREHAQHALDRNITAGVIQHNPSMQEGVECPQHNVLVQ